MQRQPGRARAHERLPHLRPPPGTQSRWWDLVSPTHREGGQTTRIAELAIEHLDLTPGATVLDLGCGAGAALPTLSAAVGPAGRVVGLDYSPRMLALAEALVAERGLGNVELRRADAGDAEIEPGAYDAVYAAAAISAVPDVPAALALARRALRPGRPLVVFDMRIRPAGPSAPLLWLIGRIYAGLAGWSGVDVLDTARTVFEHVTLPDVPGTGGEEGGWPPVTFFVAR